MNTPIQEAKLSADEVSLALRMAVSALVLIELGTTDRATQDVVSRTLAACAVRYPKLLPVISEMYIAVAVATSRGYPDCPPD